MRGVSPERVVIPSRGGEVSIDKNQEYTKVILLLMGYYQCVRVGRIWHSDGKGEESFQTTTNKIK